MSGTEKMETGLGYVGDLVWQADKDRFLSMVFAPEDIQHDLLALYAFNVEVAKTAEVTSEPITGEIRLQWWREAIDEIYEGTPRQHEVVQALHKVVHSHGLPRVLFDELIDARTFDLYEDHFESDEAQKIYIDRTAGHVSRLAAHILGGEDDEVEKAGLAGALWGRLGLIRALGFHASRKRFYFRDAAAWNDLFQGRHAETVTTLIIREVAEIKDDLASLDCPTRNIIPAVLPLALAPVHLKVLGKADHDPFKEPYDLPSFRKQWRMWRAKRRGKV